MGKMTRCMAVDDVCGFVRVRGEEEGECGSSPLGDEMVGVRW
jgi:hypothetical protein